MTFLLVGYSSGEGILKLIGLLLLCFIIILASYYTTKLVGGKGRNLSGSGLIVPLEAYKIAPNKYLQLVQIGEKYFVLAVCKENITVITEVPPEQIPQKSDPESKKTFREILTGALTKTKE